MRDGTHLLAEHYQKSYEATLDVWNQRNQTFLILLAVVGAATLLEFNASQAQPLLVDLISKVLSVVDPQRQKELRASFPYGLIQSILLMVVLYLTLVLYHRTTFIYRSYSYLGALENEIRAGLGLAADSIAFTREGSFYYATRPLLAAAVGAAYVGMLGLLLFAFLGMRIHTDFNSGNKWFLFADIFLAIPTLMFYGAYALSTINLAAIRRYFARR
jgi:hypothetical protein